MNVSAPEQTGHEDRPSRAITITVNGRPVVFQDHKTTGAGIKAAAITQGLAIQVDFALFEVKGPGKLKPVGDSEEVTLHEGQSFRALAPDDNS
jgi:hypothetical protein